MFIDTATATVDLSPAMAAWLIGSGATFLFFSFSLAVFVAYRLGQSHATRRRR